MNRSEEVRDFYERMPYPAPLTSLDEHRDLYKNPDRRRAEFHLMWPAKQPRENQEILIAGCGTSQAARYALREPDARITAIDVSDTSLRHTRDLQRKYNLENLELHQLPIERVREIGRSFDLVVCTGVLHHLPDPDHGLRALRDVLRPSGAMRLMVYARYGRAGIYMMQEYCRLLEIDTSATDLRESRRHARSAAGGPSDLRPAAPVEGFPASGSDGGRTSSSPGSRLHRSGAVCLARSVRHVLRSLDRAGSLPRPMRGIGAVARTLRAWPRCPRGCSTPPSSSSAEQWSRTVSSRTATISSDESQPITFAGDSWRDYVPIALPWTVCVRERLPPGSVAVLINRSHTFTDLILTVDSFEDRLLGAIDGNRTLAEILQFAAQDGDGERRALRFLRAPLAIRPGRL